MIKKRMTAVISALLVMLMLVGMMTGCGLSAQDNQNTASLLIQVEAQGYGSQFARALANAYNQKNTGVTVEVVEDAISGGAADMALQTETSIDIFFTVGNNVHPTLAGTERYKWADLSDVYNAPLVGYVESGEGVTIKDKIEPFILEAYTYKDGKQYAIPWTPVFTGWVYNASLWESTNTKLQQAGQAPLEMPRTTEELWALLDRINTPEVQKASGSASGFTCATSSYGYLEYIFGNWYAQYAGKDETYNFVKGMDANGVYTAEIFKSDGRYAAYEAMRELLLKANGYNQLETDFKKMQVNFIKGKSFFSSNGDWMEMEASSELNPGDSSVQFIRLPMLSAVVNNPKIAADFTGTAEEKDAKLATIVDYIDANYGNKAGSPVVDEAAAQQLGVSRDTLQFLTESRLMRQCSPCHTIVVPEYSDMLEEAKDFLAFVYSKEGQEIFMQSTYGVSAPLLVDYTQFDYYENATALSKSKMNMLQNSLLVVDEAKSFPMQYVSGGMRMCRAGMIDRFGSANPGDVSGAIAEEYDYYSAIWSDLMDAAGVSN